MTSISESKLNYELVCKLNKHINLELTAFYFYMGAKNYFNQYNIAFKNVAKYFENKMNEEKEHAELFQNYIISRFGKVELFNIEKPYQSDSDYTSILSCMEVAYELENEVYKSLLDLHKSASELNDAHLTDFIEGTFLEEQVNSIKEINDYIINLNRIGSGLGEYIFDNNMFNNST